MYKKPVKLDMGFDEALRRLAQTPASAVKNAAISAEDAEEIKTQLAIEKLKPEPPAKGHATRPNLVEKN
jgi:hypothetical protein